MLKLQYSFTGDLIDYLSGLYGYNGLVPYIPIDLRVLLLHTKHLIWFLSYDIRNFIINISIYFVYFPTIVILLSSSVHLCCVVWVIEETE